MSQKEKAGFHIFYPIQVLRLPSKFGHCLFMEGHLKLLFKATLLINTSFQGSQFDRMNKYSDIQRYRVSII